jgi:CheY-like chemotaxis protein
MPTEKAGLLIVDDYPSVRETLSTILAESGYRVRSAEDGFSALIEIRNEIPDIILSDLNMPGMSGFELLSVVRRRFPVIRVIAMSGAFSGRDVPPGVAADAFYEKGSNVRSLLQMVEIMAPLKEMYPPQRPGALAPIWIPKNGHDPSGEEYVMVTCPECLRAFPQVLGKSSSLIQQTGCAFCHSSIDYAIVQAADPVSSQAFQWNRGTGTHAPLRVSPVNEADRKSPSDARHS